MRDDEGDDGAPRSASGALRGGGDRDDGNRKMQGILPPVVLLNPALLRLSEPQPKTGPSLKRDDGNADNDDNDDDKTPLDGVLSPPQLMAVALLSPTPIVPLTSQNTASNDASDDYVLPGTNINFKQGLELYKAGTAFGVTPEKTIAVGGSLTTLVNRIGPLPRREMQRVSNGVFNEFFRLESDVDDEILRVTRHPRKTSVGMRRTRYEKRILPTGTRYEQKLLEAWTETFIGLRAAIAGIGPKIFATGITATHVTVTLMERGRGDLKAFSKANLTYADGLTYAQKLADLMKKSGELGLFMADIKSENLIVMNDDELKFIDFDSSFTAILDDASAECVEFLNSFLLLSYMYCWIDTLATRGITFLLRNRMSKLLPRLKASEPRSLCNVFLKLAKKDAYREYWLSKAVISNPRALAEHVLFMASHYLGWVEDDEKAPQDYKCGRDYDHSVGSKPIIEQILERVLREMADPASASLQQQ